MFLVAQPIKFNQSIKNLYQILLEYSSIIWSSSYAAEIILKESVRRDFTKRIPGCAHLSYIPNVYIF